MVGKMRLRKSQSAIEFLSAYAWAFIIVSMFVAVVAILSFSSSPASNIPTTCYIQPLMPCIEAVMTNYPPAGMRYIVEFTNKLRTAIYFAENALNATTNGVGMEGARNWTGNCTPQLLPGGGSAICSAVITGGLIPSAGSSVSVSFALQYEICRGTQQSSCSNSVYKTTGFSQEVVGQNLQLYSITLHTSTGTGYIAFDGVAHASNTIIVTTEGEHFAAAIYPVGYVFDSWSGSGVTVSPTYNRSSTVTVNSNGSLLATFSPT